MRTGRFVSAALALAIVAAFTSAESVRAAPATIGHAYTLSNDLQSNAVIVLDRLADGTLAKRATAPVATGGKGVAGVFDAQGAVRIDQRRLFAVNPGSDSIAVFDIGTSGELKAVAGSPFASNGPTPLSIAVHRDLVYVANQGLASANPAGVPNVTGFRLGRDGRLSPIAGSTIEFPAGAGPADVEFNPQGTVLAVTSAYQNDGAVRTFAVQRDGSLKEGRGSPHKPIGINGTVGFSWTADGRHLLVSNFRGSAVTVYSVDQATAALTFEGVAYPNNQEAMCWTVLSPDGKTLYTSNFVSNSISAYSVAPGARLVLLGTSPKKHGASSPDSKDLQISPDGRYLYVVGPAATQIASFAVGRNGPPQELPEGRSPFTIGAGQLTTGLALN
ncbi:MAG: beta-propeller fold lactonase family protein [Methylobacteriaceae bacterium]|nr:beta-propeller fold lactonase family protein [Methylobacteriaceae bacterium]